VSGSADALLGPTVLGSHGPTTVVGAGNLDWLQLVAILVFALIATIVRKTKEAKQRRDDERRRAESGAHAPAPPPPVRPPPPPRPAPVPARPATDATPPRTAVGTLAAAVKVGKGAAVRHATAGATTRTSEVAGRALLLGAPASNRDRVRAAMIWAEVLGPPKALRRQRARPPA